MKSSPLVTKSQSDTPTLLTLCLEEERGQAMAEMVVLLPVYLLLLILAMYVGHHQVVRQQTIEAARYFAWNGRTGSAVTEPRFFFPRYENDGTISITGANQANNGLPQESLPDTEIKKHANGGAATLATEYMNNRGGRGVEFGRRHVVVSYKGLKVPAISNWLGITLSATRQHSVYVIRDTKKHSRFMYNDFNGRKGELHPFFYSYGPGEQRFKDSNGVVTTTQMDHAGSLPKFAAHQDPWRSLTYWEDGGRGPRPKGGTGIETNRRAAPGSEAERHYHQESQTLWNRTHKLDGVKPANNTNPFFENVWRRITGN